MAITLHLKPEVEAQLLMRAEAAGLSLAQFPSGELEAMIPALSCGPSVPLDGSDGWEESLDESLDSFPQRPMLGEEALERDNWYRDRW